MSFHERLKRRRLKRFLRSLAAVGGIAAGGGLLWLFFWAPVLTVREIAVRGGDHIASQIRAMLEPEVFGSAYVVFKKNHPVFIDENFLKAKVMEGFAGVGDAELRYNYLARTLEIFVEERKPVAHVCARGNCFLVDRRGIVYASTAAREGSLILTVRDMTGRDVRLGMRVVPEGWMDFMSSLRESLKEIAWITTVVLEEESLGAHYVRLETADGWALFVDTDSEVSHVEEMLRVLFTKELAGKEHQLEYIDLRVPNRAYYRLR